MKNYELSSDEVVLYKGDVKAVDGKDEIQLILTNLNIVFITTHKKIFGKEEIVVDDYPVDEIKIYNGVPQLKPNGNIVEIYLLNDDKEVVFSTKREIRKFIDEATNLLTHKTKIERCAEKVKKTIDLVNDTFDTDIVGAVKTAVKDGVVGNAKKVVNTVTNTVTNKGKGFVTGLFNKKKVNTKQIEENSEE